MVFKEITSNRYICGDWEIIQSEYLNEGWDLYNKGLLVMNSSDIESLFHISKTVISEWVYKPYHRFIPHNPIKDMIGTSSNIWIDVENGLFNVYLDYKIMESFKTFDESKNFIGLIDL